MSSKLSGALASIVACTFVTSAAAQTAIAPVQPAMESDAQAPPVLAPAPPPAVICCKVPALATVELEFVDPASSRTSKAGEMIALRLVEPLVVNGHEIAPVGTKAFVEIVQASKAGLMSKAGELTFGARYLEIGSTRVPLKRFGYGRSQGSDPSGTVNMLNVAAAAALPIASVALIFVSGGNVDIKAGARAHATVASETLVPTNQSN